jgi:hypothetical protein
VPYVAVGAAAFVLYFCASWMPFGGYLFDDTVGLPLGIGLYCVTLIVLAVPIFAVAAFISSKV